jgi:protein-disulfide isomerase
MPDSSQSSAPCNDLAVPVAPDDHAQGPPDAPITLVEYGDYECPDCLNAQPLIAALQRQLGNKLRVIFRHFPMYSIHPRASAAAQAAEAAAAQGRFWDMHESLFRHQKELATLDLTHLALRLGFDVYAFERDMGSETRARRVRRHYDGGAQSGVQGTPTFFLNGCRYRGPAELEPILAAIKAVLRSPV